MIEQRARAIAEDILFPAAMAVDAADRVPASHLDLLAATGFYGIANDPAVDYATLCRVVETLASGCLTTAFVWMQSLTPVRAAAAANRTDLLPALVAGERRGGIGLAGIRNPHNPLRVRPAEGGYVLTGQVPWITGWDMIDCVYVAALDGDLIHFLLVDAVRSPSLTPTQQRLVAVEASRTVNVVFEDHFVPADRLLSTIPYDEWLAGDTSGSTLNGFLSLGLARRCCLLLGPSGLDAELDAARTALLSPDEDAVPQARARASELALRAAVALTVRTGARAVLRDQHAQRLMREATFLLVFGSRRTIQAALLERLVPAL